jgi:hypothetical protein
MDGLQRWFTVIRNWYVLLVVPFILATTGCGLLYTNVVQPHSGDFNNTPIGSKQCTLSAFTVRVPLLPVTRQRVQAQWDTEEVNAVLEEAGMTKMYYTDIKTQEFLLGTFRRQTVIIYGD